MAFARAVARRTEGDPDSTRWAVIRKRSPGPALETYSPTTRPPPGLARRSGSLSGEPLVIDTGSGFIGEAGEVDALADGDAALSHEMSTVTRASDRHTTERGENVR
jgi:hypothetical protein